LFISRRFFLKTQLAIPDELRKEVNRHIKEGKDLLAGDVFDGVQAAVENLINETTYPNFLKSDMYLQHVQVMQNGELSLGSTSSSSSSGSSSGCGRDLSCGGPPLPTLYEDIELVTETGSSGCGKLPAIGNDVLPLTKDMLIATQKRRASELRPKPEAYVRYVAWSSDFLHQCYNASNWCEGLAAVFTETTNTKPWKLLWAQAFIVSVFP
jgi:axin 1